MRSLSGIFAELLEKRHLSAGVPKLIGHKPVATGGQLYKRREKRKQNKTNLPESESNTEESRTKGVGRVPDKNI